MIIYLIILPILILLLMITLILIILLPKNMYFNQENNLKGIPKNIFITVSNLDILKDQNNKITKIINKTKINFPDYNIKVYGDTECYELIKDDKLCEICYNEIIPSAFKADIFRLVILYKYGGIYIDAGIELINSNFLKELISNNNLILCYDRPEFFGKYDIYNALMISNKNNKFILALLNNIKERILNFQYGSGTFDITGPTRVGLFYKDYFGKYCKIGQRFKHIFILKVNNKLNIVYKNNLIAKPKIRDNLGKSENLVSTQHYTTAWSEKKVFYQLTINNWYKTAKNYKINKKGYLCADLLNKDGKYIYSKIKYKPFSKIINNDGHFLII